MESAFVSVLLAQAGVSALLGTRLYPIEFPQDPTFPAMTYQTVSAPRDYTQDGPDGLTRFRVQCRIRALTPLAASAVRDAIIASNANGLVNAEFGSPARKVHAIFVENEVTEHDPPLQTAGTKLYGMRLDLIFWVSE